MERHIKTAILALLATLLVAASVFAAGKPKIVAVEPVKDVGTVAKGEKIVNDFVIRNEGDAVLEITNVQPACGCTVAEFDKSIAPGQTGKIHAVVDTTTFNGPISKGVSVFSNDPDTPQLELTIRAKVEPYVSVKPGYARYITVQGEPLEGNIAQTIWVPDGTPMDITSVDSPWPFLKVSFREAKPDERVADAKGKVWRVEMSLSNDAKVGPLSDYVTIHTNHPKQKIVQIPVSGFVRPVVAVTPPVADFGKIELKEPLRKALNIRNFATEPIKVTGIEQNVKGIDAKLEPLEEGREYQVRLVLNPTLAKGPFNGKITIHTDSPKIPLLEVELKGTVL
ncbi:MAG TPA: DUF1573 domain-containing protein [Thermoanaerobaculia bacterium]|jgi:hypothetical protein|nr:DUF1573 domain-containing protein [Thermoanaerobaculia bacterium]